jgi:hypothetical protein
MNVVQRVLQAALIAAALALPTSAEAQDGLGVTFGVGPLTTTDADAVFPLPFYVGSVQGVFKRHFVIEGEVSHWTHTLRIERGPHDIFGPAGRIGSVTGTTTVDTSSMWNFGANFLVQSTGAVRVFGGAGASMSLDNSEYSQHSFGCSPSLDPRTCEPFTNARRRGPIPVFRALGGVEVPLGAHTGIFGSVRAETSTWEDRRTWISAIAGVRLLL